MARQNRFRWSRILPILDWLPNYQRGWFRHDLVAGITVLTVLVPEGLAYAQMAGMPPEAVFYAAPAALILYALFTTSRQVVVGPTSSIAAMSAASRERPRRSTSRSAEARASSTPA